MSVCPVCEYQNQKEVSNCQRCNWLMEDNLDSIGISAEHPILKTCIPALVKCLKGIKDENKALRSHLQTLNPDIQKENSQKLYDIIEAIKDSKQKYLQELKFLTEQVTELKSLVAIKNDYSNVITEGINNSTITENIQILSAIENTSVDFDNKNISNMEDSENSSVFPESNLLLDNNHNDLPTLPRNDLGDKTGQSEFSQTIDIQTSQFVEIYNKDKNLFDEYTISTVTETKDSRDNRLAGRSEIVFLSSISKGNYWIVEENNNFYLVPHAKISINEHNKRYTIENLFECDESSSGDYNFKLIRPAKILKVNSELWQLEKKGKLEFF